LVKGNARGALLKDGKHRLLKCCFGENGKRSIELVVTQGKSVIGRGLSLDEGMKSGEEIRKGRV